MEFRILGPLQVIDDGRLLEIPANGKRATVMAALLVHGNQVVPADRLITWLWGEDPGEAAAATLRAHIWRLRGALATPGREPDLLLTRRGGYELQFPPDALDAHRFTQLARAGRASLASDPTSGASSLREALSLWRGRALEGFADQPFARAESLRLEDERLSAIEDLMEAELAIGPSDTAITGELRSLVDKHPTRERLNAQLMRALYGAGRQADALQVYRDLRTRLVDELGIEPSLRLRQLERAVLRQDVDALPDWVQSPPRGPQHQVAPRTEHPHDPPLRWRTPFVGREVERAELRSLIERTLAGQGGLVMIGGEPGVGKSRLSQEIAAEARGRCTIRVGHCYEKDLDLPYMPWVEMLESLVRELAPQALREALGEEAPEFARLVPQVRHILPDIPPPLELPPDQQRRYTFNCLREYVTRASGAHPRLFILEDLHWADESTLRLLEHLAQRLGEIPCLVIGTYRDAPVDISPRLADALSTLVRHRQARLMSISRHSEQEVETMLRGLSGHMPPAEVTAALYAETDGNAFFVEEVYRHLAETGRLLDAAGRFRTEIRLKELEVPANVRLVVGQRIDRLGAASQRVLTMGAVIGRYFDLELLVAVAEMDGEALLDALDEAERSSVLTTQPSETREHYWFAHELIRQTLLSRLSSARRHRHHLRVAEALERIHGNELQLHAVDIAHHLVEAGDAADPLMTARFLTLAGERALAVGAFEEALRRLTQALTILPTQQLRARADLLLGIGLAHRGLGQWSETHTTWSEALAALQASGDDEAVARLCYEYAYHLGWAYRVPEALMMAEQGLAAIAGGVGPLRPRLLAISGILLAMSSRLGEAASRIEEATKLTAGGDVDTSLLGEVGFAAEFYCYCTMQLRQATEPGRRAATALRQAASPWHLASALSFLHTAEVFQGRFLEAEEIEHELYALADRVGHTGAAATGRRSQFARLAAQHADLTELDGVRSVHAETALTMGSGWLASACTLGGMVELWRGDWESARAQLEEASRCTVPPVRYGIYHGHLAVLLALWGMREQALAVLDEVRDVLPRPGMPTAAGSWTLAIAAGEVAGLLDEAGWARDVYPLVVEALASGTIMRQYDGALIHRAAGMCAAAADLRDEADAHFRTALLQAKELPHLMERPHVQHFYARFLVEGAATGDLERAHILLDEAIAGYRGIGMPRHVKMAEQLRQRSLPGEER
jgi:DNA-binding SARP family transcriptional activator/tetratricopeptide (TPR) repeat protein